MKRSLVLGSILGILLTLIASYFLLNSNALKTSGTGDAGGAELREAAEAPLTRTFDRFTVDFKGRADVLTYRSKIELFTTLEAWDQGAVAAKLPTLVRFTRACEYVAPTRAIFVPAAHTDQILASKINLHFVGADRPSCFGIGWKIAIVEDNFIDGKTLYKVIGEATVDRIAEAQIDTTDTAFFKGIRTYQSDVGYLANMNYGPNTNFGAFTAIHYTLNSSKPILDPNVVPGFVPGAISLKPAAIEKFFRLNSFFGKPVFVDARDRANVTSVYPGAIAIPFIPSNPIQTRFQFDFPISLLGGAKFDLRALPASRETALLIFGNDSADASPLWVIRALRLQNYHRLFYVEGGLKELAMVRSSTTL